MNVDARKSLRVWEGVCPVDIGAIAIYARILNFDRNDRLVHDICVCEIRNEV